MKPESPVQKSKRTSIFGTLFHKVTSPSHGKPDGDASALKGTTVSSTAPQLESPVDEPASKPIEPESVTAPAEPEVAKDAAPAASETTTPQAKGFLSRISNLAKPDTTSNNKQDGKGAENIADTEETPTAGDTSVFKEQRRPSIFRLGGGLFRKPSRAVKTGESKKDKEPATEAEPVPEEDKPEPISKDAPAEDKPVENGDSPAAKEVEAPADSINVASTATPVQAAA
jgi:hypothetical protein